MLTRFELKLRDCIYNLLITVFVDNQGYACRAPELTSANKMYS